jgi:hypothetical protein
MKKKQLHFKPLTLKAKVTNLRDLAEVERHAVSKGWVKGQRSGFYAQLLVLAVKHGLHEQIVDLPRG